MKTARRWMARLAGLFGKARREADMSEELQSLLEMHTAENLRAGMQPAQARREARIRLSGIEPVKEEYRANSTIPMLEHVAMDFRFAVRQLRKSPAFAGTAVLVLALGMCASIAIFGFVDAALIKPLPYPDPSHLLMVTGRTPQFASSNVSYLDYQDYARFNTTLQSIDVYNGGGFLFDGAGGAEPVVAGNVSGGFFQTLGVRPLLGRTFLPAEEIQGAKVVVLSYAAWQQRFGAAADVVGRVAVLSGEPFTIVGVLPADFQFAPLGSREFWTPINIKAGCPARRSCHNLYGIARPKPGVSFETAQANLSAVAKELERQNPDSNRDRDVNLLPFAGAVAGGLRPILLVLMGGAGLLLLIACVNVSSLVLARSEVRKREIAVRSALGASVARLCSQFVTEGVVLVSIASAVGLLSANAAMQILRGLIPADKLRGMPFLLDMGLNGRVLTFAAGVAALAMALFSLAPVLHLSLSKSREHLAEGSRGSSGKAWRRLGSRLVIVELAIAMVLLVGAGLFVKSLYRLLHVPLGFRSERLAMIEVNAPGARYGKPEQQVALARAILSKVEGLPGVESAALTSLSPVSYNGNTDWIRMVGKPYDGHHNEVNDRDVSAAFFQTIGARLARGRYFTDAEDLSKPKVMIINQTLAKKYFPGEDPIGKQIGDTSLSPASIRTIIGVVEDVREGSLDDDIWPTEYHPILQDTDEYFVVVARTSQRPEGLLPALAPAIHQVHSDVGTRGETTMESRIANSMTAYLHRSSAWLVGGFAAMALLLGVVGLYGVIAYSVSQRTREIGVRIALGAGHAAVYRMVLREAGWLAGAGIGLGAACAVGAATLARGLLFGVSSWDLETLVGVAVLLALATGTASFVPARRAASVNPVEALRAE